MEIDEKKFQQLLRLLLDLVIQYEVEATACRFVLEEAQRQTIALNLPFHVLDAFHHTEGNPATYVAVEADYAEIEPLLHSVSSAELSTALDRALSAVLRKTNRKK